MVLQKRHLPDEPLEYLVKYKRNSTQTKAREKWITDKTLLSMHGGRFFLKEFNSSKVGQLSVDAYLGKRRSTSGNRLHHPNSAPFGDDNSVRSEPVGDSSAHRSVRTKSVNGGESHVSLNSAVSRPAAAKRRAASEGASAKHNRKYMRRDVPFVSRNLNKSLGFSPSAHNQNKSKRREKANSSLLKSASKVQMHKEMKESFRQHSAIKYRLANNNSNKTVLHNSLPGNDALGNRGQKLNSHDDIITLSDTSSDDGVLYSLTTNSTDCTLTAAAGSASSRNSLLDLHHRKRSRKLPKLAPIFISAGSDSEVDFKISQPVVGLSPLNMDLARGNSTHPDSSLSSSQNNSAATTAGTQLMFGANHPMFDANHPVARLLDPSSTVSADCNGSSYTVLNSLTKSHRKRNHSDTDEESSTCFERRISIRQTESAFRFKDIVVKKCPGYMHVALVSQTQPKNALNPKVNYKLVDDVDAGNG